MDDAKRVDLNENDGYEAPSLTEYGSIEEWTKGGDPIIAVSIFI